MKNYVFIAAAAAGLLLAAPAQAGDAAAGEKVFKKCKAFHSIDRETNQSVPHFVTLICRDTCTFDVIQYYKAMAGSHMYCASAALACCLVQPHQYTTERTI